MKEKQKKRILDISMSLDGYLATKEDDISWLSIVNKEGEDYGYEKFIAGIDTYIVGKTTYDVVVKLCDGKFPQGAMFDSYVITRQTLPSENGVTFYNGDLEELINKLKQGKGKNIYCDGGAQIVKMLMSKELIDEYIISIMPIILGDGKRLFIGEIPGKALELLSCKNYESGLIQVHYSKKRKA